MLSFEATSYSRETTSDRAESYRRCTHLQLNLAEGVLGYYFEFVRIINCKSSGSPLPKVSRVSTVLGP